MIDYPVLAPIIYDYQSQNSYVRLARPVRAHFHLQPVRPIMHTADCPSSPCLDETLIVQPDIAALRFLNALHEAGAADVFTDIDAIGFKDVETVLSVFKRCKAQFWVVGDSDAAWLTPAGRRIIGKE